VARFLWPTLYVTVWLSVDRFAINILRSRLFWQSKLFVLCFD